MIPRSHPYWQVRSILERREDVIAVPASYYTYMPRTVADTRLEFLIPADEFMNAEKVLDYMKRTPKGHEMAVHSNMETRSRDRTHLVMIDMATSSRAHLEKLRAFLGENFFQRISWYASGRSFHGYGEDLLKTDEWVRLMGLLLLANLPKLEPTVDPRWIGHRLVAGYASLRWTKNTSHYLGLPANLSALNDTRTSRSELEQWKKKAQSVHIKR